MYTPSIRKQCISLIVIDKSSEYIYIYIYKPSVSRYTRIIWYTGYIFPLVIIFNPKLSRMSHWQLLEEAQSRQRMWTKRHVERLGCSLHRYIIHYCLSLSLSLSLSPSLLQFLLSFLVLFIPPSLVTLLSSFRLFSTGFSVSFRSLSRAFQSVRSRATLEQHFVLLERGFRVPWTRRNHWWRHPDDVKPVFQRHSTRF